MRRARTWSGSGLIIVDRVLEFRRNRAVRYERTLLIADTKILTQSTSAPPVWPINCRTLSQSPTIPTAGSELICFDHGYPKSKKPSHKCNREQRGKPTADGRRFTRIGIHLRLFFRSLRSFAAIIVLPLEAKQIRRIRIFRGIQPDAPIHPRPRGRARMDRFPRTST